MQLSILKIQVQKSAGQLGRGPENGRSSVTAGRQSNVAYQLCGADVAVRFATTHRGSSKLQLITRWIRVTPTVVQIQHGNKINKLTQHQECSRVLVLQSEARRRWRSRSKQRTTVTGGDNDSNRDDPKRCERNSCAPLNGLHCTIIREECGTPR